MKLYHARKTLRSVLTLATVLLTLSAGQPAVGSSSNGSLIPSCKTPTTVISRTKPNCETSISLLRQLTDTDSMQATITRIGDMRVTAAHVALNLPDASDWMYEEGKDIATQGETSCEVVAPYSGQLVSWSGYPAGSWTATTCTGRVIVQRSTGDWLVKEDSQCLPVVPGMSGGVVVDTQGRAVGIITVTNYPVDIDQDGKLDESFQFEAIIQ